MKIISVVGARPNFMKVAPIHRALNKFLVLNPNYKIKHLICHTGQHYDENMSKIFFNDLELPEPNFYLGIGSGSHAEQTGKIMIEFEKILLNEKPDLIIVVGDVNSTLACSLTAVKLGVKVAHVEAGLRSFDHSMPEEINRILTDAISDYLFVTEKSGLENLKREGIADEKVFFVGNCMIDSLVNYLPKLPKLSDLSYNLLRNDYVLVTLHRPSNVDNPNRLKELIDFINKISKYKKVIFPVHPRTYKAIENNSLPITNKSSVYLIDPLGYLEFITLMKNALFVVTDSGGIQEETTYLGVTCITLRTTTERPITVDVGTNYLIGEDLEYAFNVCKEIFNGYKKVGKIPELWDGKAAERIVDVLFANL